MTAWLKQVMWEGIKMMVVKFRKKMNAGSYNQKMWGVEETAYPENNKKAKVDKV